MSKVLEKLDKVLDTQTKQAVTLERLTVTVEDHVRRTNLLEEGQVPLKKHVDMMNGAFKLIAICGILVTILEFLHRMFK